MYWTKPIHSQLPSALLSELCSDAGCDCFSCDYVLLFLNLQWCISEKDFYYFIIKIYSTKLHIYFCECNYIHKLNIFIINGSIEYNFLYSNEKKNM